MSCIGSCGYGCVIDRLDPLRLSIGKKVLDTCRATQCLLPPAKLGGISAIQCSCGIGDRLCVVFDRPIPAIVLISASSTTLRAQSFQVPVLYSTQHCKNASVYVITDFPPWYGQDDSDRQPLRTIRQSFNPKLGSLIFIFGKWSSTSR